jgi:hypothetical protein
MGLDISAVQVVEFARERMDDDDWGDAESPLPLIRNQDVPDRGDGLADGLYRRGGESMSFRAGSYSGYNLWRAWLCKAALGVSQEEVWRGGDTAFAGKPFVELINFSDCEGFIGPKTSAKLALDFAEHEARILKGADPYNADRYRKWRQAFEMAAGNGAVKFH